MPCFLEPGRPFPERRYLKKGSPEIAANGSLRVCSTKAPAEPLAPTNSKVSQTLKDPFASPDANRYRLEGNGRPGQKARLYSPVGSPIFIPFVNCDRRRAADLLAQVAQGAFILVLFDDRRPVSFLVENVYRTDPDASAAGLDARAF